MNPYQIAGWLLVALMAGSALSWLEWSPHRLTMQNVMRGFKDVLLVCIFILVLSCLLKSAIWLINHP